MSKGCILPLGFLLPSSPLLRVEIVLWECERIFLSTTKEQIKDSSDSNFLLCLLLCPFWTGVIYQTFPALCTLNWLISKWNHFGSIQKFWIYIEFLMCIQFANIIFWHLYVFKIVVQYSKFWRYFIICFNQEYNARLFWSLTMFLMKA